MNLSFAIKLALLLSIVNADEPDIDKKVVGGRIPPRNSHPWLVSIQQLRYGELIHICGGTILNERQFISAAHCFEDGPSSKLVVMAGVHRLALNWRSPKWPHLSFKISKVEMHENYDTKVLENDIAMVTIDGTFNFESKYLAPIKLAPSSIDHLPDWTMCSVLGWGRITAVSTGSDEDYPEFPYRAYIPLIDQDKCHRKMGPSNTEIVYSGNFCAGIYGKDSCNADSGGPLICQGKLYGIVSWGPKVCGSAYGLYTSVPYFRDWIDRHAMKMKKEKKNSTERIYSDYMIQPESQERNEDSTYDSVLERDDNGSHRLKPSHFAMFLTLIYWLF